MPAIWSSSERPISVRMVWVDGIRHAILSQDDPLLSLKTARRRPQSSGTVVKDKNYPIKYEPYKPATQTESCASFDSCFVKLRLVVEKSSAEPRTYARRQSAPVCTRLQLKPFECENYDEKRDASGEELAKPADEDQSKSETQQLNTLSERVLQWLDLSGKVQDFEPEEEPQQQQDSNDSGKEEDKGGSTRRKYCSFKDEGSAMKIVVPTQYFVLQERERCADGAFDMCERRFCKRKVSAKKESRATSGIGLEGKEEAPKNWKARGKDEDYCDGSSQSLWAPPGRPQLHIFMPSLKPTEIQWMSSQESLFCE